MGPAPPRPGCPMTITADPAMTSNRPRRRYVVENDEFAAFVRRIIRAHARRVATGDIEALAGLAALSTLLDGAIADAVFARGLSRRRCNSMLLRG